MHCGACCAAFRVSFHWMESSEAGGRVPAHLTRAVPPHRVCMEGTQRTPVRCVALAGEVGGTVSCAIYADRPSPCREFERGPGNEACARARALHGLAPLN